MRTMVSLVCILCTSHLPNRGHVATCPVGFQPPDCQEQCSPGLFGINCASLCPATCTDRSCKPNTGFCYKCQAGFTGPKCSMKCRSGFFGQDCKSACPVNCFRNLCDPFTGLCEKCLQGYGGVKCEQRSVLRNSSVQVVVEEDNDSRGVTKSTSKSIVIYVLVVAMSCVLPVCAVVLCVKCAKKHSSRDIQLGPKSPPSSRTPVLLSTHPRRPGRLTLKYDKMQTIEEESSNQLTLDDDSHRHSAPNPAAIYQLTQDDDSHRRSAPNPAGLYQLTLDDDSHRLAAPNQAAVSVTALDRHDGFYNPYDKYTLESSQTTPLGFTKRRTDIDSPHNCREMNLFNNDSNPSFDFSKTTKELQYSGVSDACNQSHDMYLTQQSDPTINFGSGVINDLAFEDYRSHKSLQASCHDSHAHLFERKGNYLNFSSEMPRSALSSALTRVHTDQGSETHRRIASSATAGAHTEQGSETPRRIASSATAGSLIEQGSETPRCIASVATAGVHIKDGSETTRRIAFSATAGSLIEEVLEKPRHIASLTTAGAYIEEDSEKSRRIASSATAGSLIEDSFEKPRRIASSSTAGAHIEEGSETQRRVLSTGKVAVHTEQGGHINPEATIRVLRSEWSGYPQECVPGKGHLHESACADLEWQQVEVIKQADNTHGDAVGTGSTSDSRHRNQENMVQKTVTLPYIEAALPVCSEATQSACQQIHSNNNLVAKVNTFPELLKSKVASVPIETMEPCVVNEIYKHNEYEVALNSEPATSTLECPVNKTVQLTRLNYRSWSDAPETNKLERPALAGVYSDAKTCINTDVENGTHIGCHQSGQAFDEKKRGDFGPAEIQQHDTLADIGATELDCRHEPVANLINFVSDNRETGAALSTGVLQFCQVRGEDEMVVGGCAQDTTCRHVHSFDYTHLSVRHDFECSHDGCNVFQETSNDDVTIEQGNKQMCQVAGGQTDQHSGHLREQAGQTIPSTAENIANTKSCFPVNGSRNNINRLHVRICQPPSSCTTSSVTPVCGCNQYLQPSVLQDTLIPPAQMPLFSISSSAPMKLSIHYCKNDRADETPTTSYQAPRYFSLSSLYMVDDSPAKSCGPLEISVLPSPPRHNQEKKRFKGKNLEDRSHDPNNKTTVAACEHAASHQHKSSAIKCDQFRQVLYQKASPCRQRTTAFSHWSSGKYFKPSPGKCKRLETLSPVANKTHENRSDAINSTCPLFPGSRALDENPIRKNILPETRNIESLTPVSAIKMSLTQTLDRDIKTICTSHRGVGTLPSILTGNLETKQNELTPDRKVLADYVEKQSYANKDICSTGPSLDRRNSTGSKDKDCILMHQWVDDGKLRRRRSDQLSCAFTFRRSRLPHSGFSPADGTRNLVPVIISNTSSSTPSDTSRGSTRADNAARTDYIDGAHRRQLSRSNYPSDHWEMGPRKKQQTPPLIDTLYPAVSDDDSCVGRLSVGNRSEGSTLTSMHESRVDETIPAHVKVQGNTLIAKEGHTSGIYDQEHPAKTHPHNIQHKQCFKTIDNCAHKTKSASCMLQNLDAAEGDSLIFYPLPTLLEEFEIWERTVLANLTGTESCLLPAEHSNVIAAHSATERPHMEITDMRGGPPASGDLCPGLCSLESEARSLFTHSHDKRLPLEVKTCSSGNSKQVPDCSTMVEQRRTPHKGCDEAGNYHRLSDCCKSQAGNQLSQEKRHSHRKDSSEYGSLPEDMSDIFYDALDSFPVASQPGPSSSQQGHNEGFIKTSQDRKRSVKFVEKSAKKISNVDYSSNKTTDKVASRRWRDTNNMGNQRLDCSMTTPETRQQNIAFRFAVPRSIDNTRNIRKSVSKTADKRRRPTHMHPSEAEDGVAHLHNARHRNITKAKLSPCEQTVHNAQSFVKNSHSGSNTSLMCTEGTDSLPYCSVSSEKHSCLVNDQHSVAEDFSSSRAM